MRGNFLKIIMLPLHDVTIFIFQIENIGVQKVIRERERNEKTCLAIDARAREKFKYVCIYAHIYRERYYCIVLFPFALRYES